MFIAKFNSLGVRQWATYYGDGRQHPDAITVDMDDNVVICGGATAAFTATFNGPQPNITGSTDAFIIKLGECKTNFATAVNSGAVYVGGSISLNASGGVSYSWTGQGGLFTSLLKNPVIPNAKLSDAGIYTVTVTDVYGCMDTAQTKVTVLTDDTTTGIYNVSTNTPFKIYPNPASGYIIFEKQDAANSGALALQILNQYGQVVYSNAITNNKTVISVAHFPSGVYSYRVTDNQQILVQDKIIIRH
jgi:hypothetical protein